MQTTSSKITQYIMDWQLQSNLQMLKINVFDSERLEEKLCEQACQLKEMSLKMENLVLEKTTIENEKAKIQELMANLDNLQGKKEEVAKVFFTIIFSPIAKLYFTKLSVTLSTLRGC